MFAPIRPYLFNEKDQRKNAFWRCPVGVLLKVLPRLGGPAVSVLVPMAFLTWPGKALTKAIRPHAAELPPPDGRWTTWVECPWLATLAGCNRRSLGLALETLEWYGLAQSRKISRAAGGTITVARLSSKLFATKGRKSEATISIHSRLVFGGMWRLFASNSIRCVYLAVNLRQGIRNPKAFKAWVATNGGDVDATRTRGVSTIRDLQTATGYTRRTVITAVTFLTDNGLIDVGGSKMRRWYAVNEAAQKEVFPPELLNANLRHVATDATRSIASGGAI